MHANEDRVVEKLSQDLNTLYENSRQLESKVSDKVSQLESSIGKNNVDLQLLTKDVKDSLTSMSDFMNLFEKHDEKEMEKYASIEESLKALNSKVDSYVTMTDNHTADMKWLKEIAAKGRTAMIRGAWTITTLGVIGPGIVFLHPFIRDFYVNQALDAAKPTYSASDKKKYYEKIVGDILRDMEAKK